MAIIVIIVIFIWCNSATYAEPSNKHSQIVSDTIQNIVDPEENIPSNVFVKYIRKSAHVIEYIFLGAIIMILKLVVGKKCSIAWVFFIVLAVAVIDESIQILSDRTDSVKDILIDSCGAMTGIILAVILYNITIIVIKKKKDNTEKNI